METSIIIRTKNEEKLIGKVLEILQNQTYKDFEIVIVDSGSTDRTLEIVKNFPVKIVKILPEEFTYPFALNVGCRNASGEKYFVFISGHSLPSSKNWLEKAIQHFEDKKILGVYGYVWALPDASVWEKLLFNKLASKLRHCFKDSITIRESGMGVLGFTNAVVRRDLWEQFNFDESYGAGGEDAAWAGYWFKKGYVAIREYRFSVYHSHGLGLLALIKQCQHWKSVANPHPYQKLDYRK